MSGTATFSNLRTYLQQIRGIQRLTREEERDAAIAYRDRRDTGARDRLVCGNLRLVIFAARRYAGFGAPLADLVEAGNLGLLQAVDRFDPDKGSRFATYALWWIRRGMITALQEHGCIVRVPEDRRRARRWCRDARQGLDTTLGRPATDEEVAAELGVSQSELRGIEGSQVHVEGAGPTADLKDKVSMLDDVRTMPPDVIAATRELRERIQDCLCELPDDEANAIRMRFGLDGEGGLTLAEITRELGLSAAHVVRLIDAGLRKLAQMLSVNENIDSPNGSLRLT